jgi:hypothetical protein
MGGLDWDDGPTEAIPQFQLFYSELPCEALQPLNQAFGSIKKIEIQW